MNIFGDDGFRSRYGEKFMSNKFLKVFSFSLNNFLKNNSIDCIAVGYDTRHSSTFILKKITEYLNSSINVYDLGIVTLGQLSYETKVNNFQFSIMITASHFHHSYNGIKLLNGEGEKLSFNNEKKLEKLIFKNLSSHKSITMNNKNNKIKYHNKNSYKIFIKNNFKFSKKYSYLIDCANGSASIFFKSFTKNKSFKVINNNPNGRNINLNCGAYYFSKKNISSNNDFVIHFDGDADRIIFKSLRYGLLSPEFLAYTYCFYNRNFTKNKSIVSSEIVNSSLKNHLSKIGFKLFLTKVGDRNVYNKMIETSSLFGFEPSGHFTFNNKSYTMDGIYALSEFLPIISNNKLIDLCINEFKLRNRITFSLLPKKKLDTKKLTSINSSLQKLINKQYENVLLRKSIWSEKIRFYYDFDKINNFNHLRSFLKKNL